ncbi:hypothetical protein BC831DRAFT_482005 [Entophlyctis helioformis]|nr:hypothetical protein BC831DRAFT_482005 [Entophlyctis helioformis]
MQPQQQQSEMSPGVVLLKMEDRPWELVLGKDAARPAKAASSAAAAPAAPTTSIWIVPGVLPAARAADPSPSSSSPSSSNGWLPSLKPAGGTWTLPRFGTKASTAARASDACTPPSSALPSSASPSASPSSASPPSLSSTPSPSRRPTSWSSSTGSSLSSMPSASSLSSASSCAPVVPVAHTAASSPTLAQRKIVWHVQRSGWGDDLAITNESGSTIFFVSSSSSGPHIDLNVHRDGRKGPIVLSVRQPVASSPDLTIAGRALDEQVMLTQDSTSNSNSRHLFNAPDGRIYSWSVAGGSAGSGDMVLSRFTAVSVQPLAHAAETPLAVFRRPVLSLSRVGSFEISLEAAHLLELVVATCAAILVGSSRAGSANGPPPPPAKTSHDRSQDTQPAEMTESERQFIRASLDMLPRSSSSSLFRSQLPYPF